MRQGDGGEEGHSTFEAGVSERRGEHDGQEDEVLAEFESVIHRD